MLSIILANICVFSLLAFLFALILYLLNRKKPSGVMYLRMWRIFWVTAAISLALGLIVNNLT